MTNAELLNGNSRKSTIDLTINLPEQSKPLFQKLTTPATAIKQVLKAADKLDEGKSLNISLNGDKISLSKNEITQDNIKDVLTEKLNAVNNKQSVDTNSNSEVSKDEKAEPKQEHEQNNNKDIDKNLEFVKDQIKFIGFGESDELNNKLKEFMKSDKTQLVVSIQSDKASFQNKVSYDLNFNKGKEQGTIYFNTYQAKLLNESKNLDLSHTFSVKQNGITAKQALNLLEGRTVLTKVNNTKNNTVEDAFIKLRLNEPKNERDNFQLKVYNKNYGIDTKAIVEASALQFKDDRHKEITIKSLEKGNIVSVNFKINDKQYDNGKAILNPVYKNLNLYDRNMQRVVDPNKQTVSQETPSEKVENERSIKPKM